VDLRLNADVQPGADDVPDGLDRIGDPGGGHRVGEPPGDIGLNRVQDRIEQRRLVRELGVVACLEPGLRSALVRQGPLAFGPLASAPLDADLTRDWVRPLASKAIRRDLAKFARGVHPRVLLDAAVRFGQFTGPVRILWGDNDAYFPTELGRQLSEAFPHASLTTVPGGRTFLPLDHPDEVASEIIAAVRETVPRKG
jgi:pimeloyl-ACP methyl ester carboxylesterase